MIKKLAFLALIILFLGHPSSAIMVEGTEPIGDIKVNEDSTMYIARTKTKTRRRSSRLKSSSNNELKTALQMMKAGRYEDASMLLFSLSSSAKYSSRRMQIKYLLGLALQQMGMNQTAAFQYISVIKRSDNKSQKYLKQSLEKLSIVADELGDDTLLNYAISRVSVNSFPRVHRDMLYYRIGEFELRNDQFAAASRSLFQVDKNSPLFAKAKYLEGLSYSLLGKNRKAIQTFNGIIDSRIDQPVTDPAKVAAILGKARVYYQMKKWDKALYYYREVPRDTTFWHDALFESSWAMLRSGQFRSAMSNFQSLHSAYYDDAYLPESLLLRSIVYLYICQYDEMDKVLNLFTKIYQPVFKQTTKYLRETRNYANYFRDVAKVIKDHKSGDRNKYYPIPYVVARKITKEGDFQRSYKYIINLVEEKRRIRAASPKWKSSGLGRYAEGTIRRRISKAQKRAGRQIRNHMITVKSELIDFFEQEGFIRYELLKGKKEKLKKHVAGKDLESDKKNELSENEEQVDNSRSRDYYIQNGYQYWKFRGEYWLDEIGNYYYVGMQSCK